MNKNQLIEQFKIALINDYETMKKSLLIIYNMQTEEEQLSEETIENNGVGFSGADSHKLTYYAKWIMSGKTLNGRFLEDCVKRMAKYSKQILSIRGVI